MNRCTPLTRKSRLRRVSASTRAAAPTRRKCIRAVKARAKGYCEAAFSELCSYIGRDCHEVLPRSQGGSVTDPANCLWVCRNCHNEIHRCPSDSYRIGFLKRGYGGAA